MSRADGQTVNPHLVEFSPSADHAVLLPGDVPAVSAYLMEVYQIGAQAPFHTLDIGKPTPESDGKIRHDFSASVLAWPLPGGSYESRVVAVGPYGTGRSGPSNTFVFQTQPCSLTITPATASVGATGGSVAVNVNVAPGCSWTASSGVAWITLAPASGSGPGRVTLSVAATSGATRSGPVTIGGRTVTITQASASCKATASPNTLTVSASAGTGAMAISAPAGCSWALASNASWLSPAASQGSGPANVSFSYLANSSTTARQGILILSGSQVTVTQQGRVSQAPGRPRNVRAEVATN